MKLWRWATSALALVLIVSASAQADRVPSHKVPGPPPATGTKPDITVPYTTDGRSTLMTNNRVEPRVYSSPIVDDPKAPAAKAVYNLPFYGAIMSFGDRSNGATPRPPGTLLSR